MNPVPREYVLHAAKGEQPDTAAFVVKWLQEGTALRYRVGPVGACKVHEFCLDRFCKTVSLNVLHGHVVCIRRFLERETDIEYSMAILNTATLRFKEVWVGIGDMDISGAIEIQTTMRRGKCVSIGFKHPSISGSAPLCNSIPNLLECPCHYCRIPQNWSKTRFTYQCRHCEQRAMLATESIYSLLHRADLVTGTKAECIDKIVGKPAPGMYCGDCRAAIRTYNLELLRVMFACFYASAAKKQLPAMPSEIAKVIVSICVEL